MYELDPCRDLHLTTILWIVWAIVVFILVCLCGVGLQIYGLAWMVSTRGLGPRWVFRGETREMQPFQYPPHGENYSAWNIHYSGLQLIPIHCLGVQSPRYPVLAVQTRSKQPSHTIKIQNQCSPKQPSIIAQANVYARPQTRPQPNNSNVDHGGDCSPHTSLPLRSRPTNLLGGLDDFNEGFGPSVGDAASPKSTPRREQHNNAWTKNCYLKRLSNIKNT